MARKVAVLDLTQRNQESRSNAFSLEHAMQVAGVPYLVTTDVAAARGCALVLVTSTLFPQTLTAHEKNQLAEYVWDGGVLVAPHIRDVFFYPLFGIGGYARGVNRSQLTWKVADFPELGRWIDDPNEITIPLSNPAKYPHGLSTQSYVLQGASILAEFDDGQPAVTRYSFGRGQAVALGFSVSDLVSRNLLNLDLAAQRTYGEGFEPAADTFFFFLLSLAEHHIPYSVRKHTSPRRSRSTLIMTHDIDAMTSMELMLYFARLEAQRNITATYFITTRYNPDLYLQAYYTADTAEIVKRLLRYGQKLGSHSVGHFQDFASFEIGVPGNTRDNYFPSYIARWESTGATVYGECEVSKQILESDTGFPITAFRSGHLKVPKYLINVLDELGYRYDSSQSANDLLTNFPHFTFYDRSTSSRPSEVIEIPMTVSDECVAQFSELNYEEALSIWLDVITRNTANFAPTVLLIHPTRVIKLIAEEMLLDRLPGGVLVMDLESYGDFWRNRVALPFETEQSGEILTISFQSPEEEIDPRLSLTIRDGTRLAEIRIMWNGNPVSHYEIDPWTGGDVIVSNIHVKEFADVGDWVQY